MKLSDRDIRERLESGSLEITPIENLDEQIQPASFDFRLAPEIRVYSQEKIDYIDSMENKNNPEVEKEGESVFIQPHEFALASTVEKVSMPSDLAAEVKGRSSIGRLGIHIHTAGWIDPGFEGQITLEIVNHAPSPIRLYSGMRICQIVFDELKTPSEIDYSEKEDAKYYGQSGPTGSQISDDFD